MKVLEITYSGISFHPVNYKPRTSWEAWYKDGKVYFGIEIDRRGNRLVTVKTLSDEIWLNTRRNKNIIGTNHR